MSTADQFSAQSGELGERKPWTTPTVTVGGTNRSTFGALNTPATDDTTTSGYTYGS